MNQLKTGAHAMVHPNVYQDDPAEEISTRSSDLRVVIRQSPRHAFLAHPRLNPDWKPDLRKAFDLGTAMHAIVLGDPHQRLVVIDADSYRTKDAQAARDAAYADRATPVLAADYERVVEAVAAAQPQLAALREHDGRPFTAVPLTAGNPEMTLIWRDGPTGLLCRSRVDWWHDDVSDTTMFWDYKTTTNAHPDEAPRRLLETGAEMQAAFYRRGIAAITGINRPRFGYIMQETTPPYAMSAVEFDEEVMDRADQRIDRGLRIWARCLQEKRFPGYDARLQTVYAPGWYAARTETEQVRDEHDARLGTNAFEQMIEWQAPHQQQQNGS